MLRVVQFVLVTGGHVNRWENGGIGQEPEVHQSKLAMEESSSLPPTTCADHSPSCFHPPIDLSPVTHQIANSSTSKGDKQSMQGVGLLPNNKALCAPHFKGEIEQASMPMCSLCKI